MTQTDAQRIWSSTWEEVGKALDAHGGEVGALGVHAMWSVEALHYLVDLDPEVFSFEGYKGHQWQILDLAHGRWAAGTAVTALDLCAACIGRIQIPNEFPDGRGKEMSLTYVDPNKRGGKKRLAALKPGARGWARTVLDDPDYEQIKGIRDPLTHAWPSRHYSRGGSDSDRTQFRINTTGALMPIEDFLTTARDCATRHVKAFLELAIEGTL